MSGWLGELFGGGGASQGGGLLSGPGGILDGQPMDPLVVGLLSFAQNAAAGASRPGAHWAGVLGQGVAGGAGGFIKGAERQRQRGLLDAALKDATPEERQLYNMLTPAQMGPALVQRHQRQTNDAAWQRFTNDFAGGGGAPPVGLLSPSAPASAPQPPADGPRPGVPMVSRLPVGPRASAAAPAMPGNVASTLERPGPIGDQARARAAVLAAQDGSSPEAVNAALNAVNAEADAAIPGRGQIGSAPNAVTRPGGLATAGVVPPGSTPNTPPREAQIAQLGRGAPQDATLVADGPPLSPQSAAFNIQYRDGEIARLREGALRASQMSDPRAAAFASHLNSRADALERLNDSDRRRSEDRSNREADQRFQLGRDAAGRSFQAGQQREGFRFQEGQQSRSQQFTATEADRGRDFTRERDVANEPLVEVQQPNGTIAYVRRSQAVGQAVPPRTPLVTVDQRGENAEATRRGTLLADQGERVRLAAEGAAATIDTVRSVRAIGAETDRLAPARAALGGWFDALGVSPESSAAVRNATSLQQFNALAQNFVLGKQMEQRGVQTDGDRAVMQQTFANATNTVEANNAILRATEAQALRQMERSEFFETWRSGQGEDGKPRNTYGGAGEAWNRYIRETPLVARQGSGALYLNEFLSAAEGEGMDRAQALEVWRRRATQRPAQGAAR